MSDNRRTTTSYSLAPSSLTETIQRLMSSREVGLLLCIVALSAVFSVFSPVFLTTGNVLNLLRQISLLGVVAVGATFVLINAEVDLSVGSIYGFAGVVAGLLLGTGLNEIAVIMAVLLLGAMFGAMNGLFTVLGSIPSFITTLGTMYLIRGITLIVSNGAPVSISSQSTSAPILKTVSQMSVGAGVSNQVVLLAAVALAAYFLLHRTRFGFYTFAAGGNERAAAIVGVPVGFTKVTAFTIAGALAALAGIVNFGFLESVQPVTGSGLELDVIAAVIIGGTRLSGGRGSILGTISGVLLLGIMRNGFVLLGVTPFWQTTLIGAVVLAAALLGGMANRDER